MGQYHIVLNLTRKEFLYPHKFGDGLKLLEFGMSRSGTMTGLAVLLAGSNGRGGGDLDPAPGLGPVVGRWAGDTIAIVGDYYENGDVRGVDDEELYHKARDERDGWIDISEAVVAAMRGDTYIARDLAECRVGDEVNGLRYVKETDTYTRSAPEAPRAKPRATSARAKRSPVPHAQAAGRTKR